MTERPERGTPGADDKEEDDTGVLREGLLAGLAIVSVLIGINRITDPTPPPVWMQAADVFIALAFFSDFVARVRTKRRPGRYMLTHAYEILFFIPFTLFPAIEGGNLIRGARLLRLVRILRHAVYLRVGLGLTRVPRRIRQLQTIAKHANLVGIAVAGIVIVTIGAGGLMVTEGIAVGLDGWGEAFWWSLSLFTTVAYDIPAPETTAGRVVSAFLMVGGIAYVGVFTASLASAILRSLPGRPEVAMEEVGRAA